MRRAEREAQHRVVEVARALCRHWRDGVGDPYQATRADYEAFFAGLRAHLDALCQAVDELEEVTR